MITAVILFGALNVLFEFVLLSMIGPRLRLRLLGSTAARNAMHVSFLLANLAIHWGTLIGTMSAVMAFVCSMATVHIATKVYGKVVDGRHYHVGLIKYSVGELT